MNPNSQGNPSASRRPSPALNRAEGYEALERYLVQKYPPSTGEMRGWLEKHGFVIEALWGDRQRTPYTDASGRAVFWARKNPPTL
jgi:hypothetical protein